MSEPSKLGRSGIYRWSLAILLVFFGMACALRDLGKPVVEDVYLGPTLTEQAYRDTQDALWETAMAEAYTQDAMTRESAYLTASPTSAPPAILRVYLPPVIPGDRSTVNGELEFSDPDGDVNRLTIEVVQAVNFGGSDYDPRQYLMYGDRYNGVYQLYIWCEGQQTVTLRYTLYDGRGNRSNSMDASFECR